MFNLIRRDVILQKRQLLIFIPFILFFIIMESHPALTFLVASIFIPFNTLAYDEKTETNKLLNSLPYTRTEIMTARYVGAIVYMILSIALTSLLLFLFNKPFTLPDIAIGNSLFLLFVAITFPLYQLIKPGYTTTVVIILFVVSAGLAGPFVSLINKYLPAITEFIMNTPESQLYTGVVLVVIIIYTISWAFSTFIYSRKVF